MNLLDWRRWYVTRTCTQVSSSGACAAMAPGNWVSLVVNPRVLNRIRTPLLLTYLLILANRKAVLGSAANGRIFRVVAAVRVAAVGILFFVVLLQTVTGS